MILCAETRHGLRAAIPPPADFGERFGIDPPLEEDGDLRVWAFPYDPVLSGLPDAADGRAIRAAIGRRSPVGVSVQALRYRPGSRAVFRYVALAPGGMAEVLYGKVLRDDDLTRSFRAYSNLRGSGVRLAEPRPAPDIDGLALFGTLAGTSLRERLIRGASLPSPARIAWQVDRISRVSWRGKGKPRRTERNLRSTGRLVAHLLPHRGPEVEELVEWLAGRAASVSPGPTVHGDLYDAQLLVDDRYSLGLIDLEDAGPGDPLLDVANFSAHLAGLRASTPGAGNRPLAYRALLRRSALERAGATEEDLTWREAASTLLLATGPFRVQSSGWARGVEARLDAALRLATRAGLAA